ncbi:DUF3833 domain-containing protein [Oceanicola sp. D3]|uniref:DUF3833 domain-containing protein n=1 Tax=Oceanicola sp. D3 TaxID=2587163 RepID=UPI00143D9A86|nr:DUF3833 domain-containing protein [Oceanicola sp. D3]
MALSLFLALCIALVAYRAQALSFVAQRPEAYAETGPPFDPRHVLSGPMVSEGVIYGPTGKVASRFEARMEGSWQGTRGALVEEFTYDSGRTQNRRWELVLHNDGSLTATAPDIVGIGRGEVSGATLRLCYRLRLPDEAGGHELDVTDWLYLMPGGAVMNRSQMRRFGVTLAELVATMRPEASPEVAHG